MESYCLKFEKFLNERNGFIHDEREAETIWSALTHFHKQRPVFFITDEVSLSLYEALYLYDNANEHSFVRPNESFRIHSKI